VHGVRESSTVHGVGQQHCARCGGEQHCAWCGTAALCMVWGRAALCTVWGRAALCMVWDSSTVQRGPDIGVCVRGALFLYPTPLPPSRGCLGHTLAPLPLFFFFVIYFTYSLYILLTALLPVTASQNPAPFPLPFSFEWVEVPPWVSATPALQVSSRQGTSFPIKARQDTPARRTYLTYRQQLLG
jgi:hypothetical protein